MPLSTNLIRKCPHYNESDILSLSPEFKLTREALLDPVLSARHRLQPAGYLVLLTLQSAVSARILRQHCDVHNLADAQFSELLGFLNHLGALQRTRSPASAVVAGAKQVYYLLHGVRFAPLAWRSPADWLSVLRGVLQASKLVILASLALGSFIYSAGLSDLPVVIGLTAYGLSTFVFSLYVHELTHVYIAAQRGSPVAVLQHGFRLGVLHRPLAHSTELVSAICGPLSGVIFCGLITLASLRLDPVFWSLALVIGSFHMLSLLPWYGDGASFRKSLKTRKHM